MRRMTIAAIIGVCIVPMVSAPRASEAANTWSPAASMTGYRGSHTATLLPSGKVLVVGGRGYLNSAEIYDPASNLWSTAASMAIGRSWHTATLLSNGKVLVAGGETAGAGVQTSAELYDPVANTWSQAASMTTPRYGHTATLLRSGKVLVAGGVYGVTTLASAELYDPATNTWSPAGTMASAHYEHSAVLLPNGKVLIEGGYDLVSYAASPNADLYDPATNTWSPAASMATARYTHTATLLPNGKVLVAGGSDGATWLASAELYDPTANSWSPAASMAAGRGADTATLLPNGTVLVAGGATVALPFLTSAELYDPPTNAWSAAASMATPRADHTATLLPNGEVLVSGGFNGNFFWNSAELYSATPPSAPPSSNFKLPFDSNSDPNWTLTQGPHQSNDPNYGWDTCRLPNHPCSALDFQPSGIAGNCYSANIPNHWVTPVAAGTIVAADVVPNGTWYIGGVAFDALSQVIIQHAGGWYTIYLHLLREQSLPTLKTSAPDNQVTTATKLGHPSCVATDLSYQSPHVHVAFMKGGYSTSNFVDLKSSPDGQTVRLCDYRIDSNGHLVGHNVIVGWAEYNFNATHSLPNPYPYRPVSCYPGVSVQQIQQIAGLIASTIRLSLSAPAVRAAFGFAYPGSYIASTLQAPDGTLYFANMALPPGVTEVAGAGFEYYTVDNPSVGEWILSLTGVDLPNGPETVTATLSTDPPATSVGGIAEQPDVTTLAPRSGSGGHATAYTIGGAALAAVAEIGACGWYVRRRLAA